MQSAISDGKTPSWNNKAYQKRNVNNKMYSYLCGNEKKKKKKFDDACRLISSQGLILDRSCRLKLSDVTLHKYPHITQYLVMAY